MKHGQAIPAWLRRRRYSDRVKLLIAAAHRRKATAAEQAPRADERPATSTIIAFPAQATARRGG